MFENILCRGQTVLKGVKGSSVTQWVKVPIYLATLLSSVEFSIMESDFYEENPKMFS